MPEPDLTLLEGFGAATARKLREAGILTIEALAASSHKRLTGLGFSDTTAARVLEVAREYCRPRYRFETGDELIQAFEERTFLTSGVDGVDRILGGRGFETRKVYEVYGPPGAGKSNLLFQLICTALLTPGRGGLNSGAIFIDTEQTFALARVQRIAERFGIHPELIPRRVFRSAPPTSAILIYLCERQLPKIAHEFGARLICLDSIATHFRSEYGPAQNDLPKRQQRLNLVLHALKRVAQTANAVVVMTNQTTTKPQLISKQRRWKHTLGHIAGHEVHVRLSLHTKNDRTGLREFAGEKSLELPVRACNAYLDPFGLTDKPQRTDKRGNPT